MRFPWTYWWNWFSLLCFSSLSSRWAAGSSLLSTLSMGLAPRIDTSSRSGDLQPQKFSKVNHTQQGLWSVFFKFMVNTTYFFQSEYSPLSLLLLHKKFWLIDKSSLSYLNVPHNLNYPWTKYVALKVVELKGSHSFSIFLFFFSKIWDFNEKKKEIIQYAR